MTAKEIQEAVIVKVALSADGVNGREQVIRMAQAIGDALEGSKLGEYDGWEVRGRAAHIYVYGPSADALLSLIQPVLSGIGSDLSGIVIRRYGAPGAREVQSGF